MGDRARLEADDKGVRATSLPSCAIRSTTGTRRRDRRERQQQLQADHERIPGNVVAELGKELPDGNAEEDCNQRKEQEREGDGRCERSDEREEGSAHRYFGSLKPPASAGGARAWRSPFRMKSRAPTLRGVELTIAIW